MMDNVYFVMCHCLIHRIDLVFDVLVATNASQSGTTSLHLHGARVCMMHRRFVVRVNVHSCVTVRNVCRAVHGQVRVLIKGLVESRWIKA